MKVFPVFLTAHNSLPANRFICLLNIPLMRTIFYIYEDYRDFKACAFYIRIYQIYYVYHHYIDSRRQTGIYYHDGFYFRVIAFSADGIIHLYRYRTLQSIYTALHGGKMHIHFCFITLVYTF